MQALAVPRRDSLGSRLPDTVRHLFQHDGFYSLDLERDAGRIIRRILRWGSSVEVNWLLEHYGLAHIDSYCRSQGRPLIDLARLCAWRRCAPRAEGVELLRWSSARAGTPAPVEPAEPLQTIPDLWLTPLLGWEKSRWGFRWLLKDQLGGCLDPGRCGSVQRDLEMLRSQGVTALVGLTDTPPPERMLDRFGMTAFCLFVDEKVPFIDDALAACRKIAELRWRGKVVALHSPSGQGTATFLAAYLIWQGVDATAALLSVGSMEPGWLRKESQVRFLYEMEQSCRYRPTAAVI